MTKRKQKDIEDSALDLVIIIKCAFVSILYWKI